MLWLAMGSIYREGQTPPARPAYGLGLRRRDSFGGGRKGLAAHTPGEYLTGADAVSPYRVMSDAKLMLEAILYAHERSEDGKRQVGALLVGPDGTVLAKGVNTRKAGADGAASNDGRFIHAEVNTLAEYAQDNPGVPVPMGSLMVVSHVPCAPCLEEILNQPGVVRVCYPLPVVQNYLLRGVEKTAEIRWAEEQFARNKVATLWHPLGELFAQIPDAELRAAVEQRWLAWANQGLPEELQKAAVA